MTIARWLSAAMGGRKNKIKNVFIFDEWTTQRCRLFVSAKVLQIQMNDFDDWISSSLKYD